MKFDSLRESTDEVAPDLAGERDAIRRWHSAWTPIRSICSAFPETRLTTGPANGGWSVQQVVQHLALSERLSLVYLRKKTQDPSRILPRDWALPIRKLKLAIYLGTPLKYRAPAMVSTPALPVNESLAQTLEGLDRVQHELLDFLASLPIESRHGLIYRHPIAGRLDLDGMFTFFTFHIRHHRPQVERLVGLK